MGETGRTLACPECRKPCLRGSKFCPHCGTLLSSLELDFLDLEGDGSLPPGTLVGSYRLIAVLGEGGMGRVYVAEHVKLGRRVAIKKLRRELASNPGAVARFFAEARAVNRIFHENIVEITDIIEQPGGDNCIIMELLKGEDLAHRLVRARALPLVRAFGIASQIASALAAVHAAGIIHRDLKPDNIFLIERGGNPDFVKVLDFGVAKLTGADDRGGIAMHTTAAGQVVGTPEYMSPEQARGDAIDLRADIYALGVILYEVLTGALPFKAKSFGELMLKHMTAPVELPSRQPGLTAGVQASRDRLLLDLLAKDPADRPASMTEVERRLRELTDAILRSESSRPGAAARPGTEAVAKVALVRRTAPIAAVEIATPRSVSRIDVLTPASIDLSSIGRPQLPPLGSSVDPTRPANPPAAATPERLAKSSSDVHPVVDGEPPGRPGNDPARSGTDPGRQAGGSIATGAAARAASPTAPGSAPASAAAPRGRASSPGIAASGAAAPGARASTIRSQGSRSAVTCATSPTASGVIASGGGQSGPSGSDAGGSDAGGSDAGGSDAGGSDAGESDAGEPDNGEPDAGEPGTTASSAIASTAAVAQPGKLFRAPAVLPGISAWRRVALGAAVVGALAAVSVAFELGGPFTASPAPAAQPTEVKIKFVSAPAGAEVRFAGARELLGITPFVHSFPRSDHPATFELAKPGFANVLQDVGLAGDDAIAVALIAVPVPPPAVPVSPAAPRVAPKPERSPSAAPAKRTAPPSERLHDRNATMDVFQRE